MKRWVVFIIIILLTASLAGCDAMQRKFTRKKTTVKQPHFYQLKKYTKKPSPELYKQHYAYWASWQEEDVTMLIPGLKRLSHQLHVDFAVNVHGTDGKRKREPVRSIYEEAVAQGKKRQPYQRKAQITPRKRMQQQQIDSPEISEIDEAEMLRHAEVLASLRRDEVHEPRSPVSKHTANRAGIIETLTKAMETVNTVHDQAIASKDEIIRTLHTATAAKDDTIRTKDEIISALNAASVAKEDAAIENLRMKDEIICMQAALIATLQTLG